MQMQTTTTSSSQPVPPSEVPAIVGTYATGDGEHRLTIKSHHGDDCCILVSGHHPGQGPEDAGCDDDECCCPLFLYCKVGNGRYCMCNACAPYLLFTLVFEPP